MPTAVRWEVSPSVGGTSSSGLGGRTFRWRMRQANRWICWQRSSRCRRPSRPSLLCSFGRRGAAAPRPAWWGSVRGEPAAASARQRLRQQRSKERRSLDLRTLQFAGFTFLLSNLPKEISTASVLALYRFRWQIEMKFKVLKSLLDLDHVPARTDQGLRVWVFAKLLLALLVDALIEQAESFSPWGYPIPHRQHLAPDSTAV